MAKSSRKRSRSNTRMKRNARARAAREGRRRVSAERDTRRALDELIGEETPVNRTAEIVIERVCGGGGRPAPCGVAEFFAQAGSVQRARAVSAEVTRLAPESVTALTFAADVACRLDGEPRRASERVFNCVVSSLACDFPRPGICWW